MKKKRLSPINSLVGQNIQKFDKYTTPGHTLQNWERSNYDEVTVTQKEECHGISGLAVGTKTNKKYSDFPPEHTCNYTFPISDTVSKVCTVRAFWNFCSEIRNLTYCVSSVCLLYVSLAS